MSLPTLRRALSNSRSNEAGLFHLFADGREQVRATREGEYEAQRGQNLRKVPKPLEVSFQQERGDPLPCAK